MQCADSIIASKPHKVAPSKLISPSHKKLTSFVRIGFRCLIINCSFQFGVCIIVGEYGYNEKIELSVLTSKEIKKKNVILPFFLRRLKSLYKKLEKYNLDGIQNF